MKTVFISLLLLSISFTQEAAYAAFEKKDYSKAIDLLDDYLDDNENDIKARFYLGQAYFYTKEFEDASDEFEEIISQGSKKPNHFNWYMKALQEDAKVSSSLGQMSIGKKMIGAIKGLYAIKPDSVAIQEQYIRAMLNAPSFVGGDEEAGLRELKKFAQKEPYKANLIYFRRHLDDGKVEEAKKVLAKIEENAGDSKDHFAIYNSLGYYLLGEKKFAEAVKAFEKQVELAPNRANPYDSLGDGYKGAGEIEKAKAAYRKALEIDPNLEASKKNLEELE